MLELLRGEEGGETKHSLDKGVYAAFYQHKAPLIATVFLRLTIQLPYNRASGFLNLIQVPLSSRTTRALLSFAFSKEASKTDSLKFW